VLPVCLATLTKQGERRSNVAFPFLHSMPRTLAQKAAKAEHLRLAAKLSLGVLAATEATPEELPLNYLRPRNDE
jgi:hypothetical protein